MMRDSVRFSFVNSIFLSQIETDLSRFSMNRKRIRWTSKEEQFLLKNLHIGAAELSKILGKTTESIYKKAKRLNASVYTKDKDTKTLGNRQNSVSYLNSDTMKDDQLELLATAIVDADSWTPRRWLAKYGDINIAMSSHLNADYRDARKAMIAKVPKQPDLDTD